MKIIKEKWDEILLIDEASCQQLQLTPNKNWLSKTYWKNNNKITGSADGRGSTLFIHHDSQNLVLRHYCRGGLVGLVNYDFFLFQRLHNARPFKELTLLSYMREKGLAVPAGIAGRVRRTLFGYRADILLARIPNAKDVHTLLLTQPLSEKVWMGIGQTIRKLHDAQVYHHDLNIKNIMLDNEGKVWVIDFDKCEIREGDTWKINNLERLSRSLDKQTKINSQFHFSQENWQMLLEGYRI